MSHRPTPMTTLNPSRPPSQPAGSPGAARTTSTAHRAAALLGSLCILASVALLVGGGVVLAADRRLNQDGFLTSDRIPVETSGYAVATDAVDLDDANPLPAPGWMLGTTRIRVTSQDPSTPVFVGIGRADEVTGYLDGVQHAVVTEIADPATAYDEHDGGAPVTDPGDAGVWVAKAEGAGTQTLTWPAGEGRWRVTVMNADGSPGVDVDLDVGAEVPAFGDIGRAMMLAALPVAVVGVLLLVVYARRPVRDEPRP
jgi:hypothetical protein